MPLVWGSDQQSSFDALKACLLCAPILGFPTEEDRFVLDMDASFISPVNLGHYITKPTTNCNRRVFNGFVIRKVSIITY